MKVIEHEKNNCQLQWDSLICWMLMELLGGAGGICPCASELCRHSLFHTGHSAFLEQSRGLVGQLCARASSMGKESTQLASVHVRTLGFAEVQP